MVTWLPQCPWLRARWGGAEVVWLGEPPSVSKASPLCFLPSQKALRKPSCWLLPGSKGHTDSRAVGKGVSQHREALLSEHTPKENWGKRIAKASCEVKPRDFGLPYKVYIIPFYNRRPCKWDGLVTIHRAETHHF